MNYGQLPLIREYGPTGDNSVKWTGRVGFDNAVQVYRTLKYDWHSEMPHRKPSLAVRKGAKGDGAKCGKEGTGYVSWNGATDVCDWAIYQGASKKDLQFLGRVPYKGFETSFGVAPAAACVKVVPVVGGKEVKGKASKVVCA